MHIFLVFHALPTTALRVAQGAWEYKCVTLSLEGHIYRDLVLRVGGLETKLKAVLCKINYRCEIQRSENQMD
jgi:hypothetical protein